MTCLIGWSLGKSEIAWRFRKQAKYDDFSKKPSFYSENYEQSAIIQRFHDIVLTTDIYLNNSSQNLIPPDSDLDTWLTFISYEACEDPSAAQNFKNLENKISTCLDTHDDIWIRNFVEEGGLGKLVSFVCGFYDEFLDRYEIKASHQSSVIQLEGNSFQNHEQFLVICLSARNC